MSRFTVTELTRLFPTANERVYTSGQIIVYDGDKPNHVMFIVSGAVKFHDSDPDGNEKIMHIGGPSSFFPLFYSFDGKPQVDGFYTTLQKSCIVMIPLKDFTDHLKTDASFASRLLTWYASEMDHMVIRLKSLEKSSARVKLLHAIAYLCEQHSIVRPLRSAWYRVSFPLAQQTLADLTGLTRETVNTTLKDIEKCGAIHVPKKMVLEIHKKKLFKLVEET